MRFAFVSCVLQLRLQALLLLLADAAAGVVYHKHLNCQRQLQPPANAFLARAPEGTVRHQCFSNFPPGRRGELRDCGEGCMHFLRGISKTTPSSDSPEKRGGRLLTRASVLNAGVRNLRSFFESDDQIEIQVGLDGSVLASEIDVAVAERSLRVGVKNRPPILDGLLKVCSF